MMRSEMYLLSHRDKIINFIGGVYVEGDHENGPFLFCSTFTCWFFVLICLWANHTSVISYIILVYPHRLSILPPAYHCQSINVYTMFPIYYICLGEKVPCIIWCFVQLVHDEEYAKFLHFCTAELVPWSQFFCRSGRAFQIHRALQIFLLKALSWMMSWMSDTDRCGE